MVQVLGWLATALVLVGYWSNATDRRQLAFILWTIGDVLWITYDIFIFNWSHMMLSATIIGLNVYGMIKTKYYDNKRVSEPNGQN